MITLSSVLVALSSWKIWLLLAKGRELKLPLRSLVLSRSLPV